MKLESVAVGPAAFDHGISGGEGVAPVVPGGAQGVFEVAGEAGGVHQGGAGNFFAEGGAEVGEAREVLGEADGGGDVGVGGWGEPVGEVGGGEQALAHPAGGRDAEWERMGARGR